MAIALYASENDIMVLNQTQLDLAIKVIKLLEPIEEITKSESENRKTCIHLNHYSSNQCVNQNPWPR